MQISWWTLALQAINFLVLVWLLWRFLYRPVREVIERRKELAERAFAEADRHKAEAEAARQRYEDQRADLVRERQDMLRKVHGELQAERDQVLADARAEAARIVDEARAGLEKEREDALAELRDRAAELASDLAARIMAEAGSAAPAAAVLDRIESRLKSMPADELERLKQDLAADGACLTVVTAAALGPDEQARWTDRLHDTLGRNDMDFRTDPALIGGAELRFPHAVLTLSWADQLEKAKELLRGNDDAS